VCAHRADRSRLVACPVGFAMWSAGVTRAAGLLLVTGLALA